MTKQEFVRNNRGIDGGKDLDPKYLAAVYKRIVNNEIVMEDERFTRQWGQLSGGITHGAART